MREIRGNNELRLESMAKKGYCNSHLSKFFYFHPFEKLSSYRDLYSMTLRVMTGDPKNYEILISEPRT